jgi:Cd2+/Zn2+-exporting ATPase
VAIFAVADTVRPESFAAVTALKALNVVPVMLTGDNPATAKSIAAQLGIQDARGNLMPEDKQAAVAELKRRFGSVGMVGDGVNDAPALAQADIGFAMGAAGTATALETADVAIMDDDPRKIADFISLSRRCATVLKQNIGLAWVSKLFFCACVVRPRNVVDGCFRRYGGEPARRIQWTAYCVGDTKAAFSIDSTQGN